MGQLSSRRYEIHRVLGKGGMGVVYEAYDSKDHTVVALKTIDPGEAEHLYRLKHEFRALADVEHENIVRFGELSHEEGSRVFPRWSWSRGKNFSCNTSGRLGPARAEGEDERVDATTAILQNLLPESGIVRKAAGPSSFPREVGFDEARLRSALAQLVSALSTIHEAGHVHRDVKPSNVLVTDAGRVVLLDFGLVAALVEAGHHAEPEWLAGTPAFMAPEQIEGETAGPEADWYAVGVILYLALTGVFPFDGTTSDIFKAKLEQDAAAPHERVPSVPADLDALCVDLLQRVPFAAAELQRPFARGSGSEGSSGSGTAATPQAPLVRGARGGPSGGARWRLRYGRARRKEARVVIVEGEPGVGKSALVHHFLGAAGGAPVVLAGRCYEQESVPFKGLDSVVDSLSEHLLTLDGAEVSTLLAGGVRHLATVFPVLTRVPAIAGASGGRGVESDPDPGLREQAFGELERLVDALASRGPLVLYVDDVQWADADSLALLGRLLRRSNGAPCLFVATLRTGMDPPGLSQLLAAGERLVVRGLEDAESRALWDNLWPAAPTPEAAAERDAAMQESAGHPLFLAELARAARAGHGHGGGGHLRLQDVLWQRIQGREPLEQRFLEMIALAGTPTPCEVLAVAAGLDAGECLNRLGSLKAAQLVRVTRRGDERLVEPFHDRIRESVAEHLGAGGDVAERHLRLGRALRDRTSEQTLPQRVFAILKHLDAARALLTTTKERLGVAALHLVASRTARLTTAYDRAQYHALEGLALTGESGWTEAYSLTRDLYMERMEAEYLGGKADRARISFDAALAKLTSLEDRATLYIAWIALESAHQRFAEAIAAGREILQALHAPLPAHVSMANVLGEYATNRIAQGRRKTSDLARLEVLRDPARESAMKILMALAPAAYCFDTNLLTWIMLRIAGASMKHGVCDVSSYGFAGYGMVLAAAFGKHTEGAAFGRLALTMNDRFNNESLAGKLHFINASYIVVWTRPIAEAKEELRRAYAATLRSGDRAYETYTVLLMTAVSFCEGADLESLQEEGEWAEEISARGGGADMAGSNAAMARYAASLRGLTPHPLDFGVERSSDAEFSASISDKMIQTRFFYDYGRAEIAYLIGETDRAHDLLVEAANVGSKAIFGMLMTVELAWLEALVAARRFDTAVRAARPRLLWTVATRTNKLKSLAESHPTTFEVYYLIALSELMRVSGREAKAGEAIERAVAVARTHGARKREAVALDLASSSARGRGEVARAAELRREANEAYRRWGAVVLADRRS